jgi:hypothetical protein
MVLRIYTIGGAPEATSAGARSRSKKKSQKSPAGTAAAGALASNRD